MELSYCDYELTPVKDLNSFSNMKKRNGLLLRDDRSGSFADYCPWEEFGDLSISTLKEIIQNEKEHSTFDHVKTLLLLDSKRGEVIHSPFKNHTLGILQNEIYGVFKIKCGTDIEYEAHRLNSLVQKHFLTFRLDFNNLLSEEKFSIFIKLLDKNIVKRIEYIEDPFPYSESWGRYDVNLATDRNPAQEHFVSIYKPLADVCLPRGKKIIFSSYMGHDLGIYHSYLMLLKYGDLSLTHGINTPGLFEKQREIFTTEEGVCTVNPRSINQMYTELEGLEWKKF